MFLETRLHWLAVTIVARVTNREITLVVPHKSCMVTDMIHTFLFAAVFQGLALLAGGILLGMVLPERSFVTKPLRHITGPTLNTVAVITPAVLPVWLHGVLAILWLLVLRVGFYLVMGAYGLLPAITSS
jgi:hypothetical protein